MAFVERCLYPFILHKCSDEFFINILSLFLILRFEFQQILQWPCPDGRHLENLKTQPAHSIFKNPLDIQNVVMKLLSSQAISTR